MSDPVEPLATSRFDRRLRVAMLGVAHVPHAMSYARCLTSSDDAELIGVHDSDPTISARLAERFGARQFGDAVTAVEQHDLDAVIVCGATDEHLAFVELAASNGLHVLCEKPIATTIDDALSMIAVCDSHGVQFHTAFVCRFYPVVEQVRAAIADGSIGNVIGLVGGNRGTAPLPPTYPEWITDPPRSGGGALIDHSVHVVDIMRHLTGLEVVSVYAEVDDRFCGAGVDDMAMMSLVFDGGAVAGVDPSWSIPAGNPWDYDFFLRIVGTEGSLAVGDTHEALRLVSTIDGAVGMRNVPFGVDIDALMVKAFVDSVRTGRIDPRSADGVDGLRALQVALAAYRSADAADYVSLSTQ